MKVKFKLLSMVGLASAFVSAPAAACPVDFSGSGWSDEQIWLFCAEYDSNMPSGGEAGAPYYHLDWLVRNYAWASRIREEIDSSYPDRHPD